MVSHGGRLYRACGWTASTPLFGSWMPSHHCSTVTDSRAASPPPGLHPMHMRESAVCSNLLILPPADPCTGVTGVQWARTGHPHYTWCFAPATVCHRTHALPVFGPSVVLAAHAPLRAHLSISERLYMVSCGGRLYRACGWTAFHLSCLSVAHGCHRTIVPVTDRRAASPPGTTSHVCARKCRVQQSFDAPTCGSLYRGHSCTMGTHWAPSLHLALCFLVPLPLCANRTYYYDIWTVRATRWCWLHTLRAHL
jgi:hypothetical protein